MSRALTAFELSLLSDDHCKRLPDPFIGNLYHMEAWLPFREAAKLPKGNANVRPPSASKKPYKDMIATVEDRPESFHLKNRGITYICERFEYDNKQKVLRVYIPDLPEALYDDESSPSFGIADGGHTHTVVTETIQKAAEFTSIPGWTEPMVRIRLIAGEAGLADIEGIVEALNTSSQVQAYTLDEYQGKFDELKNALDESGFPCDVVAFRENEDKPWHVTEILQRLGCFLKERWEHTHPASMYRGKSKALKLYTDNTTRSEFRKLYKVLRDVITLPEMLESMLSQDGLVDLRGLGKLRAVKKLKKAETREGTNFATSYKVDLAALLPMAGAFRELLQLKGDRYEWRVKPADVFRRCGKQLYKTMVDRVQKSGQTSALGSDMEYWSACSQIVLRAQTQFLEEKFAELS